MLLVLLRFLLDDIISGSSRFYLEIQRPYFNFPIGSWARKKAVNSYYRWGSRHCWPWNF